MEKRQVNIKKNRHCHVCKEELFIGDAVFSCKATSVSLKIFSLYFHDECFDYYHEMKGEKSFKTATPREEVLKHFEAKYQ